MNYIRKLMKDQHMSQAELSWDSGVPDSTLRDILNDKVYFGNCKVSTLLSIAEALDTTVEDIMDHCLSEYKEHDSRVRPAEPAAHYYSATGIVLNMMTLIGPDATVDILNHHELVDKMYDAGYYGTAFFMIGLMDYLAVQNGEDLDPFYDDFRHEKLETPLYPMRLMDIDKSDDFEVEKIIAVGKAIPEFKRFNIIMTKDDIPCRR